MELNPEEQEKYQQKLVGELRTYAFARLKSVKEGSETEELAAALLERYGFGLARAFELLGIPLGDFVNLIQQLMLEIDPEAPLNRQKRWEAKPAGISIPQN
ncbi:hypothetical protein HB364_14110 [Pseudoflavitalea sp. X16]|uniref:hypothetical protein n=1 Tax=Paraflavitalea devenefica TaxID=2716334 RepID=UPI00142434A7|nr:hypothetical protein [Paraflavitalea devenefica]NII26224.1 hypothetical protein [Paraflavitalea devenefica]